MSTHPPKASLAPGPDARDEDLIVAAYLDFLADCMEKEPELVRPLTAANVAGLDEMLAGVEVDLEAELGDDEYHW